MYKFSRLLGFFTGFRAKSKSEKLNEISIEFQLTVQHLKQFVLLITVIITLKTALLQLS
jgi:hypothetical protein